MTVFHMWETSFHLFQEVGYEIRVWLLPSLRVRGVRRLPVARIVRRDLGCDRDVLQRRRADHSEKLCGLSSAERGRADVIYQLQGGSTLGQGHPRKGGDARDASLVRRSCSWRVLQRPAPHAEGY